MSVRILLDVEEAISREVRRLTFAEQRARTYSAIQRTFDPFTGEVVERPIEPSFYDSSADASNITYPHVFVRLLGIKEDLETGRLIPQYGKGIVCQNSTTPKAYEIKTYQQNGSVAVGNTLTSISSKIKRAVPGDYLRILSGENKGTYIIESTDFSSVPFSLTVSNNLVVDLPEIIFDSVLRTVHFQDIVDLNTIKPGDIFVDSDSNEFIIDDVWPEDRYFTIAGTTSPETAEAGLIRRAGDVFTTADLSPVVFLIMDYEKPVFKNDTQIYSGITRTDPAVPINVYYQVVIDSKERMSHIEVANRFWEEFNPPRTGLPTVVRTKESAETTLAANISSPGTTIIDVTSNEGFRVNDPLAIFDDFSPTKDQYGNGFQPLFTTKVVRLIGENQLEVADEVPYTFTIENHTKVVSNAQYIIHEFHLQDHVTRDVLGAQYWSHEFTFEVQTWINRQGEKEYLNSPVYKINAIGTDGSTDITVIDCD